MRFWPDQIPPRLSLEDQRPQTLSIKRLLLSRQPSTSRASLAVTTLAAQQNRREFRWH